MYNILKAITLVSLIFSAHVAFADTAVSGALTGDVVWAKADGPYIVNYVSIPSGSSLTIEPGTIIKVVEGGTPFSISGTLTIGSLGAEQVVITSFKDDTVGGDTNGDGTATTPAAGDWRTFTVSTGAVVNIQNTDIKYGGYSQYSSYWGTTFTAPMIANNGGVLTVSASTFGESAYMGILQNAGTTTVTDSLFSHIAHHGIASMGGHIGVTNTTFDTMERGVAVFAGSLELGGSTFTQLTSYAVSLDGTIAGFHNHGGNVGASGMLLGGTFAGGSILPKDGLTYIVKGVRIPSDSSLAISPGVNMKVSTAVNPFVVYGTLSVGQASSLEQIHITSINDDTVGGDTNGDGGATTPHSGDWWSILVNSGGVLSMDNVDIRYGGRNEYNMAYGGWFNAGMITNDGGSMALDNVTLRNAGIFNVEALRGVTTIERTEITGTQYGILATGGTTTIHNSRIHGNALYGVHNSGTVPVDATNNWWGSTHGPRLPLSVVGAGDMVSLNVDYTPWLNAEPSTTTPATPTTTLSDICVTDCFSNVLFLPGIMGSRLYWTDPSCALINCENKLWIPNRDDDVEKLYMATGTSLLSDIYTKEDDILLQGTFLNDNFYKAFADEMNSMVASNTINTWKPIAYDWRYDYDHLLSGGLNIDGKIYYDVPTSFPYILEELYALATSSKTGKVTIVAHSNGGLLGKALIQKLKDMGHADLVDNLILVASPQLGTPQAIGALLHGYDASGLKYYVGKSTQRKLAHDMPMTYNLLPSEKYLSAVSTPVITLDEDVPAHDLWGDEINSTGEYLAYLFGGDHRPNPDFGELEDPAIANETLLTNALQWHANFDDWTAPTTTTVYQVAGWGMDTVSGIRYSNDAWLSNFSWDYEPILTEDGDGTVVAPSALGNDGQKYWVNLNKYKNDTGNTFKHGEIFEVPQLRTLIKNIIRKEDITNPGQYISTTRPSVIDIEKRLRYFLHSPLTLELFDSAGRHVGVSTTTGLIEEQIPGASYNEFGEVKYISVPASASTTLVMRGESEGRFTLNIQEVAGGVITSTTTFANIPVSTSTLVTMSVPENPTLSALSGLSIDQDGNGTTDTLVLPNTTLTPDRTPPEERITFSTSTQKLQFAGLDVGGTNVLTTATSTTVTDASGNTLLVPLLSYKEKNRRILLSFNTLVYNGSTTTIATTTMKYKWNINKKGEYTMFAVFIKTGSTTIETHYRPKKNQTIIMTKPTDFDGSDSDDADNRPIKAKLSGFVVPGIQTGKGGVNIIY